MRLRYYLRGLGIGIIVTTLVLGININKEDKTNSPVEKIENEENLTDKLSKADKESKENVTIDALNGDELVNSNDIKEDQLLTLDGSVEDFSFSQEDDLQNNTSDDILIQGEIASEVSTYIIEETSSETAFINNSGSESEIPKEVQQILDQNDVYTLEVVKGDDSGTVSRKLYNAGLVDNASQFDAFLTQHGYDKKINVGQKKIPKGSSWMEIAQKLAGK